MFKCEKRVGVGWMGAIDWSYKNHSERAQNGFYNFVTWCIIFHYTIPYNVSGYLFLLTVVCVFVPMHAVGLWSHVTCPLLSTVVTTQVTRATPSSGSS